MLNTLNITREDKKNKYIFIQESSVFVLSITIPKYHKLCLRKFSSKDNNLE